MPRVQHNTRALLLALGMPDFNAGMCLIVMMQAPSTTDPDMPPVILITRQIQLALNQMGAGIPVSGQLDQDTDDFLRPLCGDGYLARPWYSICEAVISAMNRGTNLSRAQMDNGAMEQAVAGFDGPLGLPEIPGGIFTYAVAGYLLYKHLKKGKR